MIPLHRQVLVGPRHIDTVELRHEPILAHLGNKHREASAMLLRYFERERLLRPSRLRPEALHDFVPVHDLDEGPALVITRSPHRSEGVARLEPAVRNPHPERDFYG